MDDFITKAVQVWQKVNRECGGEKIEIAAIMLMAGIFYLGHILYIISGELKGKPKASKNKNITKKDETLADTQG